MGNYSIGSLLLGPSACVYVCMSECIERVREKEVLDGCCLTSNNSTLQKEAFSTNLLILLGNVPCSEMQIESI